MLTALFLVASLATPSAMTDRGHARWDRPSAAATTEDAVRLAASMRSPEPDPNAPDRDPSFVEQYLSFQLSPQALPAVKNGMILSYVFGYLLWPLCGALWGPVVAVEGAEFTGDVALSCIVSSLLWSVIATALTFTAVGAILWFAVPYLTATSTLNAIDRQLKKKGLAPPSPNGPPKATPPPSDGEPPPPAYAY